MNERGRSCRVFVFTFGVILLILCLIFLLCQYKVDTETKPQSVCTSPAFSESVYTKYTLKVKVRRKVITGMLDLMVTGGNKAVLMTLEVDQYFWNEVNEGDILDSHYVQSKTDVDYLMPGCTVTVVSKERE